MIRSTPTTNIYNDGDDGDDKDGDDDGKDDDDDDDDVTSMLTSQMRLLHLCLFSGFGQRMVSHLFVDT